MKQVSLLSDLDRGDDVECYLYGINSKDVALGRVDAIDLSSNPALRNSFRLGCDCTDRRRHSSGPVPDFTWQLRRNNYSKL